MIEIDRNDFVLDASFALAAVLPYQGRREIAAALLETLHTPKTPRTRLAIVPAIWPFEIAHVLLKEERGKRLLESEADDARRYLFALRVGALPDENWEMLGKSWLLARRFRLGLYDASYLNIALTLNLPLATFDQGLRQAGIQTGVRLLPPEL